jgi:FlaA1/EpsC-like NDP-sugar epimerase
MAGWPRYALILLIDAAVVSLAFYLGFVLRFEGRIPTERLAQFRDYLPALVAIRVGLHVLFGLHRWSFRFSGLHEAARLLLVCVAGSGCFVTLLFFQARSAEDVSLGPPRSVLVIEFLLTTGLLGALRFSPRLGHAWYLDTRRSQAGGRVRAVIVGAGSAGELLLRDLRRSDEHSYDVVGFVDDDPHKWGASIAGRRVFGPLESLPELARLRQAEELLFAIPRLPAGRLREVLNLCASLKLRYRTLPVSFAYLSDRSSASALQELQPEDLLSRQPVVFDEAELRGRVQGRRLLVTGAAGSIGGEICRQAAALGPASLVLVDQNENELYLLYRRLQARHPGTSFTPEVADIRDRERMGRLAEQHRPQDVFHAAAHKHVPLMELAPEDAVRTNVIGCRNMAVVADAVGAESFVLISTDKAVAPSSVMGATKAVAEMIVRQMARRSRTAFTAVRFGNVLGSAGSAVPLFKEQIAAGGPVTLTHPDCRRYLMTLDEAVGLVFVAGLSGYGDLCILEMGEATRILDLARHMITLSGQVPGRDVEIVFTGLRPGEKLEEQIITPAEQASSRRVRDFVRVVESAPPPDDLHRHLERLESLASGGERAELVAALQAIVPDYRPDPRWAGAARAAVAG